MSKSNICSLNQSIDLVFPRSVSKRSCPGLQILVVLFHSINV